MAEKDLDAKDIERKVLNLADSMRKVKTAQADRDDVVVDMKHAKVSRLELLAEDLQPVFDDIPKDNDQFEFALVQGENPRLWIDMTSFVRMGKDGRHYELVKDTRLGRTILGNSEDREKIGERITDYIAERLLVRDRMIEGEWQAVQAVSDETATSSDDPSATAEKTSGWLSSEKALSLLKAVMWFLFGIAIAACVILGLIVFDQFEPLINWVRGIAS
jgi:hypothetical protein